MQPQIQIPSFDTWTSLFLVVSALGFFLSILLLSNKKGLRTNLPIILMLIGFSFIMIQYVFFWTGYRMEYHYVYFFDTSWYYAFGPLLYLYIVKLYQPKAKISYFHFAPPLFTFALLFYYWLHTDGFFNPAEHANDYLFSLCQNLRSPWVITISFLIYSWVITDFLKFQSVDNTSETHQIRARWIRFLQLFFWIFAVAYVSYYVLSKFDFFNVQWDYAISFSMAIGIYGIGFFVFKQPAIFNGELLTNLFLKQEKANGSTLTEATKQDFYEQVEQYMSSEKPFMDNTLRLVHLADKLNISSHLLSQVINEKSGMNFNQYVNQYRLVEAEKMLLSEENIAIKTIYFDVGFNNKVTFYKSFKAKYGCTPSEYKKEGKPSEEG